MIRYQIEVRHQGLKKYRMIRGNDEYVLKQKAQAQLDAWNGQWRQKAERQNKEIEKQKRLSDKQSKLEEAANKTEQAIQAIEDIQFLLKNSLKRAEIFNWEKLRNNDPFPEPFPTPPKPLDVPSEPRINDLRFKPVFGFVDKIFPGKRKEKEAGAKLDFECVHREWEEKKAESEKKNRDLQDQFQKDGLQWELNKQEFIKERLEKNDSLDQRIKQFLDKKSEAVIDYFENVLSRSEYPDYFPQEFDIDYDPKNKILIVAYSLPDFESLPKIKEVKYVQSKDDFIESILNESAQRQLYDNMAYEVALRTIHELYQADAMIFLEMIVFNGWVESMDTAKGKKVNACILSVQANRKEFSEINLMNVEPKACFKSLKGVGSSKLSSLTPIAPILDINREDKRFISAYEVADELNASTNLAAMDWEDFEQLVRELFEKEFAKNGGEVKITQASRDGGVDAVAFDPDPIRGGKIVIQAKRYTNTVGVSAVRDLYGTLMNEGANKGILVTTADYGPDSYEFAKGKPLTLLNGSNLLSLLEKYGKKARIDLKAAKIELSDK
jgi:restriction system protein